MKYNKITLEALAKDLSESAMSNRSDFYAECIADFMTNRNNAKAISKAVYEEAVRILNDIS